MAKRSRKRDKWQYEHEPSLDSSDDEDWVEWGGELIYAMGFTAGGAPYGITAEQYRAALEESVSDAGRSRAKRVLRTLMHHWAGPQADVDVGRVVKIGEGLSREIFAAEVQISSHGHEHVDTYVVLLPRRGAPRGLDARTLKELRLTSRLAALELPFHVPEPIGALPVPRRLALARRFVRGVELDLRTGRQPSIRPWEVVAEVAAAIHTLDVTAWSDVLPGHDTRRAHAEAAVAEAFAGLIGRTFQEAREWALAHLPPATPAALVHGDLLGQNILLCPGEPPAVIDWEHAMRGDPAYDLAIVTRGVRRPFQLDGGLTKLLEAYARQGLAMTACEVRVHELCLYAHRYRDAEAGRGPHSPRHEIEMLEQLMRRTRSM